MIRDKKNGQMVGSEKGVAKRLGLPKRFFDQMRDRGLDYQEVLASHMLERIAIYRDMQDHLRIGNVPDYLERMNLEQFREYMLLERRDLEQTLLEIDKREYGTQVSVNDNRNTVADYTDAELQAVIEEDGGAGNTLPPGSAGESDPVH